jgi:predicted permease
MINEAHRDRFNPFSNYVGLIGGLVAMASLFPPINQVKWHGAITFAGIAVVGAQWLIQGIRRHESIALATAVYSFLIGAAVATKVSFAHPPRAALGALTGATVVAALVALALTMRERRRRKELDRLIVSEATSIAFAIVMLALVTSGLLEALIDVRPPSAWWFFALGGVTWSVANSYLNRKYS